MRTLACFSNPLNCGVSFFNLFFISNPPFKTKPQPKNSKCRPPINTGQLSGVPAPVQVVTLRLFYTISQLLSAIFSPILHRAIKSCQTFNSNARTSSARTKILFHRNHHIAQPRDAHLQFALIYLHRGICRPEACRFYGGVQKFVR